MKTIILILTVTLAGLMNLNAVSQERPTRKGVFAKCEVAPVYPGGDEALKTFLKANVVYPAAALAKGITGKVFIEFVIDEKGIVTEPQVARGVSPELDAEALRVVKLLPEWTPGKEKGIPVKVSFTLPVQFMVK